MSKLLLVAKALATVTSLTKYQRDNIWYIYNLNQKMINVTVKCSQDQMS